jgi:hypothetical protein
VDEAGDPWFCAADLCRVLDLADPTSAVRDLDADEKGPLSVRTPGGPQDMLTVTEPGLYRLLFRSSLLGHRVRRAAPRPTVRLTLRERRGCTLRPIAALAAAGGPGYRASREFTWEKGNNMRTNEVEAAREYPVAVERAAKVLRRRFESGELRGWVDGDADRFREEDPPFFLLEDEVSERWVKTPIQAIAILARSPNAARVATWEWTQSEGQSLRGAAVETMALDVLAYARARGWTRRRRGEVAAKLLRAA